MTLMDVTGYNTYCIGWCVVADCCISNIVIMLIDVTYSFKKNVILTLQHSTCKIESNYVNKIKF